jgi:4-amino-4-deoxy-L-arabinose transferase-like glycosyltransferase
MIDTPLIPRTDPAPTPARLSVLSWLASHQGVVLAFAALLILATGVRLLTFDRYLPYLDYADENNMYLMGRDWRGVEDVPVVPEWLAGYPPLYVWMNIGVQQVVEATWRGPWLLISDYFYVLRLIAALTGIVTTLLVIMIGWQVGGAVAGWMAGLVWGLSPVIVEHNSLAIPDPMVYLACAITLISALRAWRDSSPRWLLVSFIAAVAAIYLKYPAAYALIPWGVVTLILLWREPRRMLPWVIGTLTLGAALALYLLFGYGSLRLSNREADTARDSFIQNFFSPDRNLNNLYFALYPIGGIVFALVIVGGVAAYVYCRQHGLRRVELRYVGLLLLFAVGGIMMTSTYSNVHLGAGKIRHVLPSALAFGVIWGASAAQIVWAVSGWLSQRGWTARRATYAAVGIIAAVVAVGIASTFAAGDVGLIQQYRKTAVQEILWRWTDANIPTDGRILANELSAIAHSWNRPWTGYDGVKTFEWWLETEEQMAASTPERYVERGITYLAVDSVDLEKYFATPALQDFISQLTLVKTFPANDAVFGNTVYFYRMLPPEQSANVDFGGQMRLVGYDMSADTAAPGETITFRPYWRVNQQPTTNYSMFIHIYPADELRLITQYDGAPTVPERPTLTWNDPGELYIGADAKLTIPADTPAGNYRLAVGVYDFNTGVRLDMGDGETTFEIPLELR